MRNVHFYICFFFLFSGLFAVESFGELPALDRERLVELLQKQEDRIQSYQVKYRLSHGHYSDDGEFEADLNFDCEYAHDIGKNHRYLHEKWLNQPIGKEQERKYAYDGRSGTELTIKLPDDPGRMYGRLLGQVPEILETHSIWQPELWGYGFIAGCYSLSNTIKNSESIEITTETLNGEQAYRVSFVVIGEKIKVRDQSGKMRKINETDSYAVWLLPEKNFLPARIERLRGEHGDAINACEVSDFRQIAEGLWLPFVLERTSRSGSRRIAIETIAINEKASVISRLDFPPGTKVTNETLWGLEYTARSSGNSWRQWPKGVIVYFVLGFCLISVVSIFVYLKCVRRKRAKL